ncbi:MAG: isopenicillin N synthase family dioxygenase [Acidimicrobiales bacterium]
MTITDRALLPVLDLGDYLAGVPGAREAAAAELREALLHVGFFAMVDHGVDWRQVEGIYEQAARFHAVPLEAKTSIEMTARRMGYLQLGKGYSRASSLDELKKPNMNAAFFMSKEPHPDPARNQFPPGLPGFREACAAYFDRMEALGKALLPLYAVALGLAPDWFDDKFDPPQATLRLSHYPPVEYEEGQFGIGAHTDAGFMTLLPSNTARGLYIRPAGGEWTEIDQPPESFIVNSGDSLRRWTNDRFLSTSHRARNHTGADRYAIPFFFDPNGSTMIECLPTCSGPGDPPRHEPITYREYLIWFMQANYEQTRQS